MSYNGKGSPTFKKVGDCWRLYFSRREQSQASRDDHGLPVVATMAMVDPMVKPWQLGLTKLARVLGSRHHGMPVVNSYGPW